MNRFALALISLLTVLTACAAPTTGNYGGWAASGPISRYSQDAIRLRHMDSVNAIRAENGLQPVQMSAALNAAADTHARDMSAQKRAWNFGSDRTSPQARAERAGFEGIVRGENVAETFKGEFFVLKAWLDDPAARAVILDPQLTHIGLGWYQEPNGRLWWVEDLGQATTER